MDQFVEHILATICGGELISGSVPLRSRLQASESCENNGAVMVLLRGTHVLPQDFSLFEIRRERRATYREFRGRSRIIVGCNVDTHFLFAHSAPASWQVSPGREFHPAHVDFDSQDADHWTFRSPL